MLVEALVVRIAIFTNNSSLSSSLAPLLDGFLVLTSSKADVAFLHRPRGRARDPRDPVRAETSSDGKLQALRRDHAAALLLAFVERCRRAWRNCLSVADSAAKA